MNNRLSVSIFALLAAATAATGPAIAGVQFVGPAVRFVDTSVNPAAPPAKLDYAHAKAMPLPKASKAPSLTPAGLLPTLPAGVSKGAVGTGEESPTTVISAGELQQLEAAAGGAQPQDFGTSNHPFSTAQVNPYSASINKDYPFRAAGKLFFQISGQTYVCSASLIAPGVVVTAAHCVNNFGQKQFYSGWQFMPGYQGGVAPYGVQTVKTAWVPTVYYNGTDSCAQSGVICHDDVALLILNQKNKKFVGSTTGWYAFGWNSYGYGSFQGYSQAHISQLGYPVDLDGGSYMERNDSAGYTNGGLSSNTIIGSLMTGGSSGGPWMVNLGLPPALNGVSFGSASVYNVVVGVTSWGYTDLTIKEQGAAPFTTDPGNVYDLFYNYACKESPDPC